MPNTRYLNQNDIHKWDKWTKTRCTIIVILNIHKLDRNFETKKVHVSLNDEKEENTLNNNWSS